MTMYCPYCDIEINEKQLEAEDGCCPECGAFITPNMVVTDEEDEEAYEGDDDFAGDSEFAGEAGEGEGLDFSDIAGDDDVEKDE